MLLYCDTVTGCGDCPYLDARNQACYHTLAASDLDTSDPDTPPNGCPLRKGPTLAQLATDK